MMINLLALVLTIITIRMKYHSGQSRMPKWARMLIFHILSKCVCRKGTTAIITPAPDRFISNTMDGHENNINLQGRAMSGEEKVDANAMNEQLMLLREMLKNLQSIASGESQLLDIHQNEWHEGADILERFFFRFTFTIWLIGTVVYCVIMTSLKIAHDN